MDFKFASDVLTMVFHGLGTDEQLGRDFLAGLATSDKIEDAPLARRQAGQTGSL
jgi:hypothetical protein